MPMTDIGTKLARTALRSIVLSMLLFNSACAAHPEETRAPSIERAEEALIQLRPAKAVELFEAVFNDATATQKDRAEAGRKLARMKWHVYNALDEARQILETTNALDADVGHTFLTLSRIEREAGNYGGARAAAQQAITAARSRYETHDAYLAFAQATLVEISYGVLSDDDSNGGPFTIDRELVSMSFAMMDSVTTEAPGYLVPTEVFLGLSLLQENGPEAYDAWCQYYRISEHSSAPALLKKPHRTLKRILPQWQAGKLSLGDRREWVTALAQSRFFDYAVLMTNLLLEDAEERTREIDDILAYHTYIHQVEEVAIRFYRRRALGHGGRGAFERSLRPKAELLWGKLSWDGSKPGFSLKRFYEEIQARFGTDVRLTQLGLSMGHRVIDEQREVEQYGKRATLRYISLDFMVSNNYTSWLWDGRARTGGWADNPVITQVRRAYADAGLRAWRFISDSLEVSETRQEIERLVAADEVAAQGNPFAYLPGLALRIKYQAYKRLLEELRHQDLVGTQLRAAFVSEVNRRNVESSIFAHEGRHALDRQGLFSWARSGAQKEFNAKLSEVAFASDPFLAMLGGILMNNIGDGGSHGQANERIMKGLVNWMQSHGSEIEGLNTQRPLLAQLDLLTDAQLKRAFRSMDAEAK